MLTRRLLTAALLILGLMTPALAGERFITLASTTSTQQSGLFGYLLPMFLKKSGIEVRVVAVGTGQALKIGMNGDADALLVHDRSGEDKFVAGGFGIDRRDVMHNDFIIAGPKADPAGIKGGHDALQSMKAIAEAEAPFASRGDDSGTNRMELRLWHAAGTDIANEAGDWYRATGAGMGPTLNTAAGMGAYVLTDRATWANFKNRQDLVVVVEGDPRLFNPYGSILVNPARFPHAKAADARTWQDWLIGPDGQAAIAGYKIDGQQVFYPDAQKGAR